MATASSFVRFDKDSGGDGSFEPAVVRGNWTGEDELLLIATRLLKLKGSGADCAFSITESTAEAR